ncbi:MAG: flagellar basal-body rod protein FlgC [Bacteriovoracaceae bacterium]|jgi:flagellar basal-body rod protein FlgC
MSILKFLFILFLTTSCASQPHISDKEVNLFCQDLSVLYQRIGVITSNIANAKTTRTAEGGPYKKKIVKGCLMGICEITTDNKPPIMKYEPNHPDSNKNGYVAYPNISLLEEESNMLRWKGVYKEVIENSNVPGNFFVKDKRSESCFKKYPALKESKDYSSYLGRDLYK